MADAFNLTRGSGGSSNAVEVDGASVLNSSITNMFSGGSPYDVAAWDSATGENSDATKFSKSTAGIEVAEQGLYYVTAWMGFSASAADMQCSIQVTVDFEGEGTPVAQNPKGYSPYLNWRTDELSDVQARSEYASMQVGCIVSCAATDIISAVVTREDGAGAASVDAEGAILNVIRIEGEGGNETAGGGGGGGGD